MTFEEFDLDERLLKALHENHFNKPTPVQAAAIPEMLEGRDVLAGAATGTGKTAAFVLPALQYLLDHPSPPYQTKARVLMLAPTRELAFQIHKVVKELGVHCHISSNIITGGFDLAKQKDHLSRPAELIVATPGRLIGMVEEEALDLSDIEMLIIDEADRMLDMGQGPDVAAIMDTFAGDFQGACFSATLAGSGVERFANEILDDPAIIQVDAPNQQSAQVQQIVYFADDKAHKQALLLNILKDETCQSALIFCNKKDRAIELSDWLRTQDLSASVLHGDLDQAKRLEVAIRFKQGRLKVLVASDVAARGLDMTNITHVVNYDLPFRGDVYIHRIGRTGRAQAVGIAINLVEQHDYRHLQRIEFHLESRIPVSKIKGLEPKINQSKSTDTKKKPHKKKIAAKAERDGKAPSKPKKK